MADKNIDLNALGQAIDTSFTRSSASSGPACSTSSIKCGFVAGDKLKIKVVYSTVVNMVRDRELQESKEQYEKEGDAYIEAATKQIVKDYREWVKPGDDDVDEQAFDDDDDSSKASIKLKRVDVATNIEIIDLNIYNGKRSALFRRIAFFEVT